ncbi:MAG: glycosyltransferase [Planctomycetes bacterium]|nr:glycosyltransferase [Planctomycetota bacterium]
MSVTNSILPRVSVLLPVYNTEESHLKECIDSILDQTYTNFELLILNDASTDPRVEQVVLSYDDPRIQYMKNANNAGIANSRNLLIERARGEYLAVMDHDDICMPDRFLTQVNFLESHPDIDVLAGARQVFGDEEHIDIMPENDLDIRMTMPNECVIIHPTVMMRKSIFEKTPFRYESWFTPAEDYALWCRLMNKVKFHNLPNIAIKYRRHAGNTGRIQKRKMFLSYLTVKMIFKQDHPGLYEACTVSGRTITHIKLFNYIPILKIIRQSTNVEILLFDCIPLFKVRTRFSCMENLAKPRSSSK